MESILKEILEKVNNLETAVNGIKDEHGQMLRVLLRVKRFREVRLIPLLTEQSRLKEQ